MSQASPLWSPSPEAVASAAISQFARRAEQLSGTKLDSYRALHDWSINDREAFWSLIWDYCGIVGERGERVLVDGDKMPGAKFFPDAKLNFAENLLKKSGSAEAIVFRGEDKVERVLS